MYTTHCLGIEDCGRLANSWLTCIGQPAYPQGRRRVIRLSSLQYPRRELQPSTTASFLFLHVLYRVYEWNQLVGFAGRVGGFGFAGCVGVVGFAGRVGIVGFADCVGLVGFAARVGLVGFADCVRVVGFAGRAGGFGVFDDGGRTSKGTPYMAAPPMMSQWSEIFGFPYGLRAAKRMLLPESVIFRAGCKQAQACPAGDIFRLTCSFRGQCRSHWPACRTTSSFRNPEARA